MILYSPILARTDPFDTPVTPQRFRRPLSSVVHVSSTPAPR